jgi:hypothetical protein
MRWQRTSILFLMLCFWLPAVCVMAGSRAEILPRRVLALYNSKEEEEVSYTKIHRVAEMPLNFLGLVVDYRDINDRLLSLQELNSYIGVLTWFQSDMMPNPTAFMNWAEALMSGGKKYVMLGEPALSRDYSGKQTTLGAINHFMAKLGVRNEWAWTPVTYDAHFIFKDRSMVEFERPLAGVLPAFEQMRKIDPQAKSYLIVRRGNSPNSDSHLVLINANGGYAAPGYALYKGPGSLYQQLYLNLFEFFRQAFETDRLPKPDPTTLCGRRIYYEHLDGDGWRNLTELTEYKGAGELSAKVILDKAIKPFPDLPLTVAPIAADIDPAWNGSPRSLNIAKEIFALPQVEAGTHTYSHPLSWEFFIRGNYEEEMRLVKGSRRFLASEKPTTEAHMHGHDQPRSYYLKPFQLDFEIAGSAAFINSLLPPGKRVEMLQWSGDTRPFEAAVALSRKLGLLNINGGDTRLDPDYPSYTWVAPLGLQVGSQRQIYASNSNENTYTEGWTSRYFGFVDLKKTLENTEHPRRLKPANIYFHMYSGQMAASLSALLGNLNFIRTQEIIPITTSNYAAIADGFYTTQLTKVGDQSWSVENRGALQTIRFDNVEGLNVDFEKSQGVIGCRTQHGSLYVALDEAVATPIITLQGEAPKSSGPSGRPYLIHSHWKIQNVRIGDEQLSYSARGFGPGEMIWKVPSPGRYRIVATRASGERSGSEAVVGGDGLLKLSMGTGGLQQVQVLVTQVKATR